MRPAQQASHMGEAVVAVLQHLADLMVYGSHDEEFVRFGIALKERRCKLCLRYLHSLKGQHRECGEE